MQSTIDGKPPPGPSTDPAKQNVLGARCTPQEGLALLQKAKANGRLPAWANLDPQLVQADPKDPSKGLVAVLMCQQCETPLKPSNMSNIASSHFDENGQCKRLWLAWKAHPEGPPSKAAKHSSSSSPSSISSSTPAAAAAAAAAEGGEDIRPFLVPKTKQDQVLIHLDKYLVTSGCPSHVEDPHLKAAFRLLGCPLPTRKEECQKRIPALYRSIMEEKQQLIKGFNPDDSDPVIGGLVTDGWKKKSCSQGDKSYAEPDKKTYGKHHEDYGKHRDDYPHYDAPHKEAPYGGPAPSCDGEYDYERKVHTFNIYPGTAASCNGSSFTCGDSPFGMTRDMYADPAAAVSPRRLVATLYQTGVVAKTGAGTTTVERNANTRVIYQQSFRFNGAYGFGEGSIQTQGGGINFADPAFTNRAIIGGTGVFTGVKGFVTRGGNPATTTPTEAYTFVITSLDKDY